MVKKAKQIWEKMSEESDKKYNSQTRWPKNEQKREKGDKNGRKKRAKKVWLKKTKLKATKKQTKIAKSKPQKKRQ